MLWAVSFSLTLHHSTIHRVLGEKSTLHLGPTTGWEPCPECWKVDWPGTPASHGVYRGRSKRAATFTHQITTFPTPAQKNITSPLHSAIAGTKIRRRCTSAASIRLLVYCEART